MVIITRKPREGVHLTVAGKDVLYFLSDLLLLVALRHNEPTEKGGGHMTLTFFSCCCRQIAKAALLTGFSAASGKATKDVFHPQWLHCDLQEAATSLSLHPQPEESSLVLRCSVYFYSNTTAFEPKLCSNLTSMTDTGEKRDFYLPYIDFRKIEKKQFYFTWTLIGLRSYLEV